MRKESKCVIVIHEIDLSDNDRNVIGVASNRENALLIVKNYYGEDSIQSNLRDIRDSNIDFDLYIEVPGDFGGKYLVTGEDFLIDDVS